MAAMLSVQNAQVEGKDNRITELKELVQSLKDKVQDLHAQVASTDAKHLNELLENENYVLSLAEKDEITQNLECQLYALNDELGTRGDQINGLLYEKHQLEEKLEESTKRKSLDNHTSPTKRPCRDPLSPTMLNLPAMPPNFCLVRRLPMKQRDPQ
mmetsp:Transcript_2849/g.3273  ORF Transcript_2849/g.3273 Transcript_2849/m.3273 type:complete len:156 (-) Transcript_2849:179-646(-)